MRWLTFVMRWLTFVGAFYVLLWPFVLLLICVGLIAFLPRRHLIKASSILAAVVVLSAAPLAYFVLKSDPFLNGIAISSLSLYPVIFAALVVALLLRGSIIWARRRQPKVSRR